MKKYQLTIYLKNGSERSGAYDLRGVLDQMAAAAKDPQYQSLRFERATA